MRISVAMTTFNGEKYLQEQLDSFLCQTRLPDELVVCDDGSSDDTIKILESFRGKASFPVKIHRNSTNLGFVKNFEKALINCQGELLFLSDQDDIWKPMKIEVVEEIMTSFPETLLIIHDAEITDRNLVSLGATKLGQVLSSTGNQAEFITGALTAIRAELLSLAIPFPEGVAGHDIWFHKIAEVLNSRLVINQQLQKLRRHDSNTSDSIVSSVNIVSRFDVFRSEFSVPAAEDYGQQIILTKSCLERILLKSTQTKGISLLKKDEIVSTLKAELSAFRFREKLVHSSCSRRKIMAISMLLTGRYKYFNGAKSFIRDFLR